MTDDDGVPLGQFFQIAYVTNNLERGMELFKRHYGIPEFIIVRTRDFRTPAPPWLRLALAYRDDVMIELVEPEPCNLELYADALRPDGGLCIHHFGYFVNPDVFETLEGRFKARGIAVPDIRRNNTFPILFADTRPETGLYSEFIGIPEAKRERWAREIPKYRTRHGDAPMPAPASPAPGVAR